MTFEWDESKAAANLDKHGVALEEAQQVFDDAQAIVISDDDHSFDEPRYLIIGASSRRLLLVVYVERDDDVIRLSLPVKPNPMSGESIMKAKETIRPKRQAREAYFDVTEADYQSRLAKGLDKETLLKPGRHKFTRGGFKQMHPDYKAKTAKVKISMYLDKDVLNHFRARADQPHAAPYQTQINNVLREVMERDLAVGSGSELTPAKALIQDSRFIAAVAKEVAASLKRQSNPRQRSKVERLRD